MKLLFLIGAEGSGHHLFRSLLKSHFAKPWFLFEGDWHQHLIDCWDSEKRWQQAPLDSCGDVRLDATLAGIFSQLQQQGVTHVYENASFPFNNPRNTLRRPDLLDFDRRTGANLQCRYLALYRDPVSMAYSAIRRKFTANPYLQCRIVEDNLIHIASQLSVLGEHRYKTVVFEELVSAPDQFVAPLAEWWNLDPQLVANDLANIRAATPQSKIEPATRQILSDFFTPQRISQWQPFYSSNSLLS